MFLVLSCTQLKPSWCIALTAYCQSWPESYVSDASFFAVHRQNHAGHQHSRRAKSRFGLVRKSHRRQKSRTFVKYWELIADNLSKAGWSWGYVSAVDSKGRTIWIVDAHRYGKRFVVRSDELLTAFVELERAIHEFAVSLIS
jgi:hypothetical protein